MHTGSPGPHGVMRLRNGRVARRYLTAGGVGFAEGYIEGDWDTPEDRLKVAERITTDLARVAGAA